jgi:GNAT superfamily N-acetyltransferase
MVKAADLLEPAHLAEERAYLDENPHADALRRAAALARIAYGRIDYSLLEGRPQIWEINTNPLLANLPGNDDPLRRPVHLEFARQFAEALAAFDAGEGARAVPAVTVRRMRAEDHEAAAAILGYWNMAPVPPSTAQPDSERPGIDPDCSVVALADGAIVGVASYERLDARVAQTEGLAVNPRWRGAGVGRLLQDARLAELKALGIETVRTDSDRPGVIDWYVRNYGYRVTGTKPKKHAFGLADVDHWTMLELDLRQWRR